MTPDELQEVLQKRLDVLQVELAATMQVHAEDTLAEKIDAMRAGNMLAGARMELQLLARYLGVQVESRIELSRSDADDALYPSSEIYETYLKHLKGTCGCPNRKHTIS